jgi:hypothetical protein
MAPAALLICSIDVEEDNWLPQRSSCTAENVRRLPTLLPLLRELGVRPTFFVSYGAARHPGAAGFIEQAIEETGGELAAHLHPWNTPPLSERVIPSNTMMCNLSPELQRAKLATLLDAIEAAFGRRPTTFRAGRLGGGPRVVRQLVDAGFTADSSVAPMTDLSDEAGPSFMDSPVHAHVVSAERVAGNNGTPASIVEVPLSVSLTRMPLDRWSALRQNLLSSPRGQALLRAMSAARVLRRVAMSPEVESASDMLRAAQVLLASGTRFVHFTWHSPTLVPGLTPFTRTLPDVRRFLRTLETVIERVRAKHGLESATVGEAATRLLPAGDVHTLAAPAYAT